MKKKTIVILLVITHLLCVLLGYCIGRTQPKTADHTGTTTEATAEELPAEDEKPSEQTTEEAAFNEVQKEQNAETEIAASTETTPVDTQYPVIQPEVTQPVATEPPATQPPIPDSGENEEWEPGDNETDRV